MTLVSKSQQVAPVTCRTFEVRTTHRTGLINGETSAAAIRAVFLDGLRELGRDEPDLVETLYFVLQGEENLDPAHEQFLQQAFRSWERRVAGEAAEQLADGAIIWNIKAKLPTARTGERNRAQVEALAWIDCYGLKYDEGDHSAFVDQPTNPEGVFFINVATVRALIKQGDIEKEGEPEYLGNKSEPDHDEDGNIVWSKSPVYDYQRWRLTGQGRRLMELGIKRYQKADE